MSDIHSGGVDFRRGATVPSSILLEYQPMAESNRKKLLDSILNAALAAAEVSPLLKFGTTLVAELSDRFGSLSEGDQDKFDDVTPEEVVSSLRQIDFATRYAAMAATSALRVETTVQSMHDELERQSTTNKNFRRFADKLGLILSSSCVFRAQDSQRRFKLSGLPSTHDEIFGRKTELEKLDRAWECPDTNVVTLVAFGGVGKSALVNRWLSDITQDDYRDAERVYVWSFYSQGTRDDDEASSPDLFITEALKWFGDPNPNDGEAERKGLRLAELIREHKTLLILDGLEPLQYPPAERDGALKHPGIRALLQELAGLNKGLCIISSRVEISDLRSWLRFVEQIPLETLSKEAGGQLLRARGACGDESELQAASDEFGGHALALTLLGHFLRIVEGGDIRRRDRIERLVHDPKHGGHARRVIESYAQWFRGKPDYQVELELLQVMGLFDRAVVPEAWEHLLSPPAIRNLTDEVSKLGDGERRRIALGMLREAGLMNHPDKVGPPMIDCHPLIREHFGEDLQANLHKAWVSAHERLFGYYFQPGIPPPLTVEAMAPCYLAIMHACFAGQHAKAFKDVYKPLLRQGSGAYNTDQLRAFADDLSALKRFLINDREVVPSLADETGFILGEIGFDLRALGRLTEAIVAMRSAMKWDKSQGGDHLVNAIRQADLLSTTLLSRGQIDEALDFANKAISLASDDEYHRMICLTTRAEAHHVSGDLDDAGNDFSEAEEIGRKLFGHRGWTFLRSFQGYRYCDYLLTKKRYDNVEERVAKTIEWDANGGYPRPARDGIYLRVLQTEGQFLPLALNYIMRARVQMVDDAPTAEALELSKTDLDRAAELISQSETRHLRPKLLLARAQWSRITGALDEAKTKLDNCLRICRRDGMKLGTAECLVELARVTRDQGDAKTAEVHRSEARELIVANGYALLLRRLN